ncbi:MAG: CubicO group peptidase (beta-lactamase class C family) [Roseivirga sp.]|jgi:CubicO group peptidase (beta-lactamase class C family)
MKIFKRISLLLVSLVIWSAFLIYGITDGFLLKSISSDNSSEAFIEATKEKIDQEFVGNLALMLIENGRGSNSYFHAVEGDIDENTVFLMASVSKWVTSWGVLALVES